MQGVQNHGRQAGRRPVCGAVHPGRGGGDGREDDIARIGEARHETCAFKQTFKRLRRLEGSSHARRSGLAADWTIIENLDSCDRGVGFDGRGQGLGGNVEGDGPGGLIPGDQGAAP